jgi:hypothetical protein
MQRPGRLRPAGWALVGVMQRPARLSPVGWAPAGVD